MNQEIMIVFDAFVSALEKDDTSALRKIFAKDIELKSSFLKNSKGIDDVVETLKWKGEKIDIKKLRVFNNVIRDNEEEAYQSFYFTLLFGKNTNDFLNLMFGAISNVIHYIFTEDGWKINRIHCLLTCESGNTSFVSNWWKMIDYSKYNGCEKSPIDPIEDNPWYAIKEVKSKNDEEQIKELFRRYNWDIDNDMFEDLYTITSKEFDCTSWGLSGTKEWKEHLDHKRKRKINIRGKELPREACWNHISSFIQLNIDNDTAHAHIIRYEPNRMMNKFVHKYNIDIIYYPFYWNMDFVKEEGEWKFKRIEQIMANDGMDVLLANVEKQRYF